MQIIRKLLDFVTVAAMLGPSTWASAATYSFINIADNSGPLNLFVVPALNDDGWTAFRATLDVGGASIFAGSGGPLTTIADDSGPFSYNGFGGFPSINPGNVVAFNSSLDIGGSANSGVFVGDGGPTTTIANDAGPFSSFFGGVSNNAAGEVAFSASLDAGGQGSFKGSGGATTTIADTSATFSGFGGSSINASGQVAFRASLTAGGSGIFVGDGGPITTIVDSSGPFTGFGGNPTINAAGTVVFSAFKSGVEGIFVGDGGLVTTVADRSGPYGSFGFSTINSNGTVAFFATLDVGGPGIFIGSDPVADKVIRVGDTLFGSTVSDLDFFRGLNENGDIAFQYELVNGVTGIATAITPIPEPSTYALALSGVFALLAVSRRKRRGAQKCRTI